MEVFAQLKGVLAAVDYMKNPERRSQVITWMENIGFPLSIVQGGTAEDETNRILHLVLKRPGALNALAEVLCALDSTDQNAREFDRLVQQYLPPNTPFLPSERLTLLGFLELHVDHTQLIAYYTKAGGRALDAGRGMHTVDDLLRELEEVMAQTDDDQRPLLHPLIKFVELVRTDYPTTDMRLAVDLAEILAKRMGGGQVTLLKAWRARPFPDSPGTPPTDSGEAGAGPALIIRLNPHGTGVPRYLVTAWFYWDSAHVFQLGSSLPVEAIPLDEIRELVPGLVEEAARWAIAYERTKFAVEFILPRELLGFAVDEWLASDHDDQSFLGRGHVVVVRDLTRQLYARDQLQWRAKWAKLRSGSPDQCPGYWIDCVAGPVNRAQLRGRLDDETWLSVWLTAQPAAERPDLDTAINAGIPIALWRRSDCSGHSGQEKPVCEGPKFREELVRRLLENGTKLMTLPVFVLELRREMLRGGEWRYPLTLFWDDPSRIPTEELLRAPAEFTTRKAV